MKKIILGLLAITVTLNSFTQDRVNRQKLSFISESETLTVAQGWAYNETLGEWVGYENVISSDKDYKETYRSLQGPFMKSRCQETFDTIQIKTLIFQEKKYHFLIISKWEGRYKYPSIEQDWLNYQVKEIYLLDDTELQKMKNFTTFKIIPLTTYDLEYENYNETKMLDIIQTEIIKKKEEKSTTVYLMYLIKTQTDKVRFLTPTTVTSLEGNKYIKAYIDPKKTYFETDVDKFKKLFL